MRRDDSRLACSVAAAITVLLLPLTATTTLWDRDEARFGQAAVEMLSSGNYLLPTFNGELRPQKPPLAYWLMTVSLRMFGQTEIAVRLWSPLAIGVAALATFVIGRRLWSPAVGLVAMLVLALTPLCILEGVAATADALLLAAITVSIAILSRALERPPTWRDVVGLGLALGVGALVKGPIAIAVPVAIAVLTWSVAHRALTRNMRLALSLAVSTTLAIALFGLWFVPAAVASSGEIATRGLVRENLVRLLEPMEGHGTPILFAPLYYPAVIAVGFIPWVVYFPRAVRRIIADGITTSPRNALLAAWMGVPLVVFTVSATKLPHYILPIWPALALSVAVLIADHVQTAWALGATPRRFIVATAAMVLGVGMVLAPMLERLKPVPHVMTPVRQSGVRGPLYAFEFEEPSLAFYGRRPIVRIPDDVTLLQWAAAAGEALLVAPRASIDRVEQRHGPLGLHELASGSGWNYVKGHRLELVAFVRPSDR